MTDDPYSGTQPAAPPPPPGAWNTPEPTKPKRVWKTWQFVTVAAIALVVGIGVGAASAPKDTKDLDAEKATTKDLRAQVEQANTRNDELSGDLKRAQSDLSAARNEAKDAVSAARKRVQQDYADRLAKVQSDSKALADQRAAFDAERARVQQNEIGEGTYQVGVDMVPGTYRTVVPADSLNCYWQITSDANGDDIQSNNNVSAGAPAIVSVGGGFFENEGCGTWTLQ
jgi:hypothetical protein